MSTDTLVILMIFGIPLAAVVGGIGLSALKILKQSDSNQSTKQRAEETRLIQDIYHGLLKMEERVEALETIMLGADIKGEDS